MYIIFSVPGGMNISFIRESVQRRKEGWNAVTESVNILPHSRIILVYQRGMFFRYYCVNIYRACAHKFWFRYCIYLLP